MHARLSTKAYRIEVVFGLIRLLINQAKGQTHLNLSPSRGTWAGRPGPGTVTLARRRMMLSACRALESLPALSPSHWPRHCRRAAATQSHESSR